MCLPHRDTRFCSSCSEDSGTPRYRVKYPLALSSWSATLNLCPVNSKKKLPEGHTLQLMKRISSQKAVLWVPLITYHVTTTSVKPIRTLNASWPKLLEFGNGTLSSDGDDSTRKLHNW